MGGEKKLEADPSTTRCTPMSSIKSSVSQLRRLVILQYRVLIRGRPVLSGIEVINDDA